MYHSKTKPTWVTPHPTSNMVYIAGNGSNEILEVDLDEWKVTDRIPCGKGPYNIDITPDGKKLIVTSATYRQNSAVTPDLLKRDPNNELLARGPRFRVPAETVRDIMLKSSGLLSPKMLGPSVYPPQPASVTGLAYGSTRWNTSKGDDRYRRSLYTFSKRTAPFAAYSNMSRNDSIIRAGLSITG